MPSSSPIEVTGESLHQDELLALAGGRRPYGGVELDAVAELVPRRADVLVLIDDAAVGVLPGEDAQRLLAAIREARRSRGAATCRALIRGGWDRGGDDVGMFGVVLFPH